MNSCLLRANQPTKGQSPLYIVFSSILEKSDASLALQFSVDFFFQGQATFTVREMEFPVNREYNEEKLDSCGMRTAGWLKKESAFFLLANSRIGDLAFQEEAVITTASFLWLRRWSTKKTLRGKDFGYFGSWDGYS